MTFKPPLSPYLYTEWTSPEERVSQTLYTAVQLHEAYSQGIEAAQAVLDALQGMLAQRDRQVWNDAIDAAIENVYCEDSYYNGEIWELLRELKK